MFFLGGGCRLKRGSQYHNEPIGRINVYICDSVSTTRSKRNGHYPNSIAHIKSTCNQTSAEKLFLKFIFYFSNYAEFNLSMGISTEMRFFVYYETSRLR